MTERDREAPPAAGGSRRSVGVAGLRVLPVLVPLLWFIATGLHGIDYGVHWDEHRQLPALERMRDTGILLPGNYWYGGVIHGLGVIAALPELVDGWTAAVAEEGRDEAFAAYLASDAFRFWWRTVFVFVTSLAILWVYLGVLAWRGSVLEASLAACFLGFSWEFAYHARWPLADAVATQFATGTLAALVLAVTRRSRAWLVVAAVAAGLATSTKYPAGLLVAPVVIASLGFPRRWRSTVVSVLVFGAAYLVSTPGTLLEPGLFWQDVTMQMHHYATQGHATYTVEPGLEHARLAGTWIGAVLLSPVPILAVALFLLAATGGLGLLVRAPYLALTVLVLPVLLYAYMSTNRVLIVRNYLMVTPFLALLAAHGVAIVAKRVRDRRARLAVVALAFLPPVVNAGWLGWASQSIAERRDETRFLKELVAHIEAHPELAFAVSARIQTSLSEAGLGLPINADLDAEQPADRFVLYATDPGDFWTLPATRFGLTETWFGPAEVNFDYYPSWWGDDRILVFTPERAEEFGLAERLAGPADERLLFRQAWMLHRINEKDGAIQRYRRHLRFQPDDSQAHFNLAHALMTSGRHEQAIPHYERCLALDPVYHEVHFHLATCYAATGDQARAADERRLYDESSRP